MDIEPAEAAEISLPAVAWAYIKKGLREQDLSNLRLTSRSLRQDIGHLVRKVSLDVVDASVQQDRDQALAGSRAIPAPQAALPDLAAAAAAYPDVRQLTLRQRRAAVVGEAPLPPGCPCGESSSSSGGASSLATATTSSGSSSSPYSANSSCASLEDAPVMGNPPDDPRHPATTTSCSNSIQTIHSKQAATVCGTCVVGPCSPTKSCVRWAHDLLGVFPSLSEVSVVGSSRLTPLGFPYTSCSSPNATPNSSQGILNEYSSPSSSSSSSSGNSCDTLIPAAEGAYWSSVPAGSSSSSSTELQLRRLSLTRCYLQTTLRQLQGLTQLSVTGCHYTPGVERHLWASLGELPCLAHLVLEVPQEVLTAQASQPHPSPPTAAAVAAPAVDGKWQALRTLEVHLTSCSGTGPWDLLGGFTALTSLSVDITRSAEESSASTSRVLRALQPLTGLTRLHLSGLQDAASSCMVHLAAFRLLEHLHLQPAVCGSHSAPQFTEDALRPLTAALPGLTNLELPSCSITLAAFSHFKGWGQLTQLQLSDSHLDDTALAAASDALKRLISLDVAGSRLVSDLGLTIIAHSCRRLTKLDLSRCSYFVTGAGVARLTALTTLTWLSLEYCDRVTGDAVASLAAAGLPLRHLNVSSCQGMTDAAVAAIADHVVQLEELQLNYCHQVTNRGVRQLAKLPELRSLHLVGTLYQRTPAMERLHAQLTHVVYCPDTEVTLRSFW